MPKLLTFLLIGYISCILTPCWASVAKRDSIIASGDNFDLDRDIVLDANSMIETNTVMVKKSVYIENQGLITGDIFLCDKCDFYIRNSGNVSGAIHSDNTSRVIQVIKTSDDITKLNVYGENFSILIQNEEPLQLRDIMNIAGTASKIVLDNSFIILGDKNDDTPRSKMFKPDPIIELVGEILVKIDTDKNLDGSLILSNVSGSGVVIIQTNNINTLYRADTIIKDNNIYLNINRETEYKKVLQDQRGRFIDDLRNNTPNNTMILALDSAANMAELENIMDQSVIMNPMKLMRAAKLFNNFESNAFTVNYLDSYIDTKPIYITSDGLDIYAIKTSIGVTLNDIVIVLSGHTGYFDHIDDMNEFSGMIYGGSLNLYFDDKSVWIDSSMGLTISEFEVGAVFNGSGTSYNPSGISGYIVSDVGMSFDVDTGFYIAPFVGAGAECQSIINQFEYSIFGRTGATVGISIDEADINYDYKLFASIQTDAIKNIGIGMFFMSQDDGAGGSISYTLVQDEIGRSHIFSATMEIVF